MPAETTLLELDFGDALVAVNARAAFVDLRPSQEFLDVHIPGSIGVMYEFGPGMAGRARDCVPLDVPLILMEDGGVDCLHAAASLRGKGFEVLGKVVDAINKWANGHGAVASTEVISGGETPEGAILDVGDPGGEPPDDAVHIPIERLWMRAHEVIDKSPLVIIAGFGVRAALAVGILERAGADDVMVWSRRSRP